MKRKFRQWLGQRFKFEQQKKLTQRDILIFIYQQGYIYLVLILITFIAGINYANNLILGFCFLISAILCISFYLTFKQLHQLEIEIVVPEVGRVGDALHVQMYFKQSEIATRYLRVKVADETHRVLVSESEKKLVFTFKPEQRGQFILPDIQLYSTYPLGLVRTWTYFYVQSKIWIAPQPQDFQQEHEVASDAGLPDLDEYRDLKNYQLGDALQLVSWKQAARGQGLYIKQFENQVDLNIVTIDYAHMPSALHEEKLKLMMGLVDQCERQQTPYILKIKDILLEQGCGEKQYLDAKLLLAQA
ncbi:DUF58 domain-containing protein [Acinetobacter shaoyimingii]|uniref:DUF58 domain-containing protein n=1 Tax=Acinetobacter shaoyimingii TaxID=2715164 RepID=A0A6G8S061_9GAMM|nr:DUF58 domain-containing protein [Acinetobacter shaoyimingii]NHB56980.1 DUF58 domain-containing protein [Acinetobacter shaoyimingii]QIO07504.1 DUF58 domain-containing protein [Acinetobacter shaoyimingii]